MGPILREAHLPNYRIHSLSSRVRTKATYAAALQRPLSTPALVLQQPQSPVPPCSHYTTTLATSPAITALAAINPVRYTTAPTAMALTSYVTTFITIIPVS
jgi:hypothetical protein